jgi:hypothetical protein
MTPARFDPYAMVGELERAGVYYVIVGALARVLHGADEVTRGLDLTPALRPQNLERLDLALTNLNARRADGKPLDVAELEAEQEPIVLESDAGEIKLVAQPAGTRGYGDLSRRSRQQPIGEGLRPKVAAADDLVRMLEALARDDDALRLETMRRVVELDRGLGLGL